jgi:hypothetical protein
MEPLYSPLESATICSTDFDGAIQRITSPMFSLGRQRPFRLDSRRLRRRMRGLLYARECVRSKPRFAFHVLFLDGENYEEEA